MMAGYTFKEIAADRQELRTEIGSLANLYMFVFVVTLLYGLLLASTPGLSLLSVVLPREDSNGQYH